MVEVIWAVEIGDQFEPEFDGLPEAVQDGILAHAQLLEKFGPSLGRPRVDTPNGSRYANMKELRFEAADGVWRVAFAFDSRRCAVLFASRDKSGVSARRFYRDLIRRADQRFDVHRERLQKEKK